MWRRYQNKSSLFFTPHLEGLFQVAVSDTVNRIELNTVLLKQFCDHLRILARTTQGGAAAGADAAGHREQLKAQICFLQHHLGAENKIGCRESQVAVIGHYNNTFSFCTILTDL